jgi:hypothetical protein
VSVRLPKLALPALLAIAAGGCTGKPLGASLTCSPPECAADTTLMLVAEVLPPASAPGVPQELTSLDIDANSGTFTLALDPVVTLTGVVSIGGTLGGPLAATVVATRPSRISGRPDVVYSATVDPVSGAFKLAVSRNRASEQYVVRVTPTDPTLVPPMQRTMAALTDHEVDFPLPDPLTLPQLHGTVLDSLQEPIAGVQLQATDPTSGQVLSTTVTSDDTGAFSLRLLASPPSTVLVTAAPAGATSMLPTLTQMVDTSKLSPTTNALTVNLAMPALPATVHVTYAVQGASPSGALMPVPGTVCVFTAEVTDAHATSGTKAIFTATAMAIADGSVGVDLIPTATGYRSYSVNVSPDASSNFQPLTTSINVGPASGWGAPISLALRPQLSGRVVDVNGQPLSSLTVVPALATLGETVGAQVYAALTAPTATTADDDGRFAVRLNPGAWDIGIIPAAATMLPRVWLDKLSISGGDVTLANAIVLPMGVIVHGNVIDATGMPVIGADVRIYTVPTANSSCDSDDLDCLAPARLSAEGTSSDAGLVSMLLSSQPK